MLRLSEAPYCTRIEGIRVSSTKQSFYVGDYIRVSVSCNSQTINYTGTIHDILHKEGQSEENGFLEIRVVKIYSETDGGLIDFGAPTGKTLPNYPVVRIGIQDITCLENLRVNE